VVEKLIANDLYKVGKKLQHTIPMQSIKLKQNGFYQNILRFYENKDSNAAFSVVKCSL